MGKHTSYSSKEKSTKMTSQFYIHKRNITKAKVTHQTPHINSERCQHSSLTNGQVIETETKQRNNETNRGYESYRPNRCLQNISNKYKRIYLLLSNLRPLSKIDH